MYHINSDQDLEINSEWKILMEIFTPHSTWGFKLDNIGFKRVNNSLGYSEKIPI
jgi:hypothetical protein